MNVNVFFFNAFERDRERVQYLNGLSEHCYYIYKYFGDCILATANIGKSFFTKYL